MQRLSVFFVGVMGLFSAWIARADFPDWNALADVDVIEVITVDPDGGLRETKVWFVLLGGEPYLRTNSSRWLENLRRDPDLIVRVEGGDYEARAEEILGEAIVEKVDIASGAKYGVQEQLLKIFRFSTPQILKLEPR